jgi:hypothetical protein
MSSTIGASGHSALVSLHLEAGGQVFELEQISPGDIILAEAVHLPPGEAEVMMRVGGEERRWRIELPDGVSPAIRRTRIIVHGH